MKRFEYKICIFSKNDSHTTVPCLNLLGEEGWELVGITERTIVVGTRPITTNDLNYIFKREKVK